MMNDIFDELNKVFGEASRQAEEAYKNVKNPILVNVKENDDAYFVEASLPGVTKEEVAMNYQDSALTIEVKEKATNDENGKYLVRERANNFYKRTISLEGVDSANIKASLTNGVLNIVLPKAKKETKYINID